jgi:hypothetical protein
MVKCPTPIAFHENGELPARGHFIGESRDNLETLVVGRLDSSVKGARVVLAPSICVRTKTLSPRSDPREQ